MAGCGCSDGCNCVVEGVSPYIEVTGDGTAANPYRVEGTPGFVVQDTPTVDLTLTGDGSEGNPWTLSAVGLPGEFTAGCGIDVGDLDANIVSVDAPPTECATASMMPVQCSPVDNRLYVPPPCPQTVTLGRTTFYRLSDAVPVPDGNPPNPPAPQTGPAVSAGGAIPWDAVVAQCGDALTPNLAHPVGFPVIEVNADGIYTVTTNNRDAVQAGNVGNLLNISIMVSTDGGATFQAAGGTQLIRDHGGGIGAGATGFAGSYRLEGTSTLRLPAGALVASRWLVQESRGDDTVDDYVLLGDGRNALSVSQVAEVNDCCDCAV